MDLFFYILLIIHIIGGATGLITGTINLIRRKGDKFHKLIGKIFTYGMLTTGFSALVLAILRENYFLFIVGVFTIYLVGTGNRYIRLKSLGHTQRTSALDWIITVGMLLTGLGFIGLGIRLLLLRNNFGIVLIVFGIVGLLFVSRDFSNYKGKFKAKNYWLLSHIQRMTGGYIAAMTAFLVVNAQYFPEEISPVIFWLLPTVILTPLIIKWSGDYRIN
jgi:uncharacterized membrane protein